MTAPPARTRARPRLKLSHAMASATLALLLGLQPITSDTYLPALPALTRALHATLAQAQQTIALLILAFGLAQLAWGPLADRHGRRPVLLAGLCAYVVASVGCALSADIGTLIAWRTVQGACLASAIVIARAMVRDLYEPHEGAQVMSVALSGLGVIALLGPLTGGALAALVGWRSTLVGMAVAGAAALAFIAWRMPETLAQPNPDATRLAPLARSWWRIATHRDFVAWGLLVSCTYGGLFTMLAGSSFVYIEMLGVSPAGYGAVLASCSAVYIAGTFVGRRWIAALGLVGAVRRAAVLTLAGGLGVAAFALVGVHTVWALLVPFWVFMFAHGTHQPVGQAAVVGPFPQHAGTASALAGCVLALIAWGIGAWLGHALTGVVPFALTIGFWATATALIAWGLVPRTRARAASAATAPGAPGAEAAPR